MSSKEPKPLSDGANLDSDYTDLLAGCCAGEENARHKLYELCHRHVYRLMVRIVGLQDAADLTQQVFLQLFHNIDKFVGRSRFETWM